MTSVDNHEAGTARISRGILSIFVTLALAGPASAANHTVRFGGSVGLSYSPAAITIAVGDTVTWEGSFGAHPLISDQSLWEENDKGSTFSFTFASAGDFAYHCGRHSVMKGTIQVRPASNPTSTSTGPDAGRVPPPRPIPPVRHLDVADQVRSAAVIHALEAILTARGLPTDTSGQGYDLAEILCANLWVPVGTTGHSCHLQYRIGTTGDYSVVDEGAHSVKAMELFEALVAAGATFRDDPAHGAFMTLKNVRASAFTLHLDDYSNYNPPPVPDVTVTGALAQEILDTLAAADIDDSDDTLLLIGTNDGTPRCSYQLHLRPGSPLSAELSARFWNAIKNAAKASGYKPHRGTIDEITIFNARSFTYDGTTLGFSLVADNGPTRPPRPTPRG